MDALREKIANPDLRRAAENRDEVTHNVIVELEVPGRRVLFEARPGDPRGFARPRGVVAESPEESRQREARTRELAALLASLAGDEPRHLAAARAFVVDLTGAQLARLAESRLVKAIAPNRKLGG